MASHILLTLLLAWHARASSGPPSFVPSKYEKWLNNEGDTCTLFPDNTGTIHRCIADLQCSYDPDQFVLTLPNDKQKAMCTKRKDREEGSKCVVMNRRCKDSLYCKPTSGKYGKEIQVGDKFGVCQKVLKETDACTKRDGSHLGCPPGFGCDFNPSGIDGSCVKYFSLGPGSYTSQKEFCNPWLWLNKDTSRCAKIDEARCDLKCSIDDVSGLLWSFTNDGYAGGAPMYRPYCEQVNGVDRCAITIGEKCLEEYQDLRFSDPLWPYPAVPLGADAKQPQDPSYYYDVDKHSTYIDNFQSFRKCIVGSQGFGSYIYPVKSKVWIWIVAISCSLVVVIAGVVVGVIMYRRVMAKKRQKQYIGNFRGKQPNKSLMTELLPNEAPTPAQQERETL